MLSAMRGVAIALATCAGCGLFPSLDGFTGGDASASDASSDAISSDVAKSDGQTTPDGGGDAAVTYRATILADKPVGYWRLGGTNQTAADELGQHAGTAHGNITFGVAGAIANDPDTAAQFVDRSGWIDVPGPFQFTGKVPFSVEVWGKSDAITDYSPLASCDGPLNGSPQQGWSFYFDLDGTLVFGRYDIDAGTRNYAVTSFSPSINTWHHFVSTVDGTTESIYVDGVLADAEPAGNESITADHLAIGADSQGTGVAFQGVIDEVAIYDFALDAAQVKHHYDVGLGK